MDIADQIGEVGSRLDDQGFESPLEQATELPPKSVEAFRVGALKPLHARRKVALRSCHAKVVVIRHYRVSQKLPTAAFTRFPKNPLKGIPGALGRENRLLVVAPVDDVVEPLGRFDPVHASHAQASRRGGLPSI